MEPTPTYSKESLDVVLREVERARQLQSTRVSNMHNRAGMMVGASGLASGLVANAAVTPLWLVPMALFALAALSGLAAMVPGRQDLSVPRKVLDTAQGRESFEMKELVADVIAVEYEAVEKRLSRSRVFSGAGFSIFALAVVAVAALGVIGFVWPSPPAPAPTYHVVIE